MREGWDCEGLLGGGGKGFLSVCFCLITIIRIIVIIIIKK